ncbi:MAG: J domain-containing protein [Chloroflexota bacterium]|nr:J domain-containing protein [Chloroflexota bacterium]MDE2894426.1 J domain-containing protein [Chloroflexota bacterium]
MPGDFYQILGVSRDASDKDISSAYRKLARQYHPDVNGGDRDAEARFKEVNAAHDVLGDPDKRAAYNRWGDQWEHAEQLEEMQRQRGGMGGFGGFGFGGGQPFGGQHGGQGNIQFDFGEQFGDAADLGDLFGNLFGGRSGGPGTMPRQPARGRDIEHDITVSLREAFHGTTRTLQRGAAGSRLEVTIPPGVGDGQRIKFTGKGEDAHGGQDGDLFITVHVDDDPVFERRGDDLHVPVDVSLTTAALGGEVAVRSLSGSGRLALRIPAGTQNGRVFRLAGQGMPRFKRDGRGDILAEVRLRMPDPLTPEQTVLFRQLRDLEDGPE